jgi:protein TonB
MVANLKLVATATSFSGQATETALNLSVKCLVPKRNVSADTAEYKSPSYKLLILVLTMHVLGLLLLLSAKPEMVMVDVPQAIMTVSLVSNRAPEPEVVPLQTIVPQPETKKQKPIVKQKIPAKVEPAKELAVEEQIAKEQVVTQPVLTEAPPTPVNVAKAEEAVPVMEAMPEEKIESEPVVEPPRFGAAYLHNPAPDYPPMARRQGEQGRVLLKVLVTETGQAETVQIENSSGYNKLDQAAIDAVKKWSFIPAKRSNQPISAYVLVPVKFSLNS